MTPWAYIFVKTCSCSLEKLKSFTDLTLLTLVIVIDF